MRRAFIYPHQMFLAVLPVSTKCFVRLPSQKETYREHNNLLQQKSKEIVCHWKISYYFCSDFLSERDNSNVGIPSSYVH